MPKAVFCTPSLERPMSCWIESLKSSLPLLEEAGWEHGLSQIVGNPYISCARADMLRKALDTRPDVIVFIDYDLSWAPRDMLTLLETEGDVVGGTYRFKSDKEEYMGWITPSPENRPIVRQDGCLKADALPAGFLKVSVQAIRKLMKAHPELVYGDVENPHFDLFNHGAFEGVWWGEDYAFCRRWKALGEDIWLIPNLNISHHTATKEYEGNIHEFLLRQPGGSKHESNRPS